MNWSDAPKWWPIIMVAAGLIGGGSVLSYRLAAAEKSVAGVETANKTQDEKLSEIGQYIAKQDGYTKALTELMQQQVAPPVVECYDQRGRRIVCPEPR